MPQAKIQDLKNQAYAIARSLGLKCCQTAHFKKRGLTVGLDLRRKTSWMQLINRLKELASGTVIPFLRQQPIAA